MPRLCNFRRELQQQSKTSESSDDECHNLSHVEYDEEEDCERCCTCGHMGKNERLFESMKQVMAVLKVVDEEMEKVYRGQESAKATLQLINSIRSQLDSVRSEMEFIDMEGAECCERMDDYKTGHILIQVSKEFSTNEHILDYWEDRTKSLLGVRSNKSKV